MLLIHCPNCEHDNTPGERFCAVCGVPLDLKPCPQCGKVDQLTAKVCSGCGAAFPPIVLAHLDDSASQAAPPVARAEEGQRPPVQESAQPQPAPPGNRAWPLILVAIAAGGIPLLWMNRAYMPLPKAWQVQGPNAAGSAAAPLSVPAPAPQPTVPPAAPVLAPDAASTEQPAKSGGSEVPAQDVSHAKSGAAQPARKESPKHRSPPAAHPPAGLPVASAVKTAPTRPCTEALAALNLCDPKADQK
jgi:hypothetical protein